MQEKGMIEKVSPGIYIDSNKIEDSYYVISNKRKKYEKNPQKDGKT